MRFTDQVSWTGFDFAAAAALLALSVEVATRLFHHPPARRAATAAAVALVALIWAEGAVGILHLPPSTHEPRKASHAFLHPPTLASAAERR